MEKIYKFKDYKIEKSQYYDIRVNELNDLLNKNACFIFDENTYKYYEDKVLEDGRYEIDNDNIIFNYNNISYNAKIIDDSIYVKLNNDNEESIIYIFKRQ